MNRTKEVLEKCRKITAQYSESVKDMIVLKNPDCAEEKILLPAIHIPIYDKKLVVEDNPSFIFQLPQILKDHYEELMHLHKKSTIYNSVTIRINRWKTKNGFFYIKTGRSKDVCVTT